MRPSPLPILAGLALLSAVPLAGQAPPEDLPCGVPLAALPPCGPETTKPSTLAVVDGTLITVKDLDEKLRQRVEGLDKAVAEELRAALQAEIDMVLLECEAARLKVAPRDYYDAEVTRKVVPPTDADVKTEYDAHPERTGGRPLADLRPGLFGRLLDDREAARVKELAASLRARFPVALKADPASPGLAPAAVLATVGPRTVTRGSAATRLDAAAYGVARAVWDDELKAVKQLVRDHLVKAEAAKRGVSPEALVRAEVDDKITPPTDAQIAVYHQRYLSFFGPDLAAARPRVVESLKRDQRSTLERDLDRVISSGRTARIALDEPARPVLALELGRSPSRGNPHATVTVVEMGDFQCPPCGRLWPVVEEALRPYGERVRYVFRQFPLSMHEFALKAAEAALAAHEQGRFWPYADLLYRSQDALDVASLKRYAAQAGLDAERFARDLDSGRFRAAALEEKRLGARAGVVGTPRLYVNGVALVPSEYGVPGIRGVIDRALAAAGTSPSPAPRPATRP